MKLINLLLCNIFGHTFKLIEETYFNYNVTTCIEQHNPFALSPCCRDEADYIYKKVKCTRCNKIIILNETT